jgi:hypothetical protein
MYGALLHRTNIEIKHLKIWTKISIKHRSNALYIVLCVVIGFILLIIYVEFVDIVGLKGKKYMIFPNQLILWKEMNLFAPSIIVLKYNYAQR